MKNVSGFMTKVMTLLTSVDFVGGKKIRCMNIH